MIFDIMANVFMVMTFFEDIRINNIFGTALMVIASLGGGGAIVLSLSSYLGKIWAQKLLDRHKAHLEKELERYKLDLEKVKNDYHRFSSKKFEIIENTWLALFSIEEGLRVYNKNEGNYNEHLLKSLGVIDNYLTLVRKNSLFFSNDITKLLNEYVTLYSEITSNLSQKINEEVDISIIIEEATKGAFEREALLEKIKLRFKEEIGYESLVTLGTK